MKLTTFKKRVRRYIHRAQGWRKAFMVLADMAKDAGEREKQLRQRLTDLQSRFEERENNERIQRARTEAAYVDAIRSRFYELCGVDEELPKRFLRPLSARQASDLVDMADCYEAPPTLLYLADDGQMLPISVGSQERHEADPDGNGDLPFYFASAPFIAGGEVVGYVHFTDH
jgi:hypothetical protein